MRTAFVINTREKGKHIYRAVASALAQTYPCSILVSDQGSTDNSIVEIERAFKECKSGAAHHFELLRCPIQGPFCMAAANAHFSWLCDQVAPDTEYIFQCSGDDYSLPTRVEVCMDRVDGLKINPACIATTMFFQQPNSDKRDVASGYPKQDGFVSAADGLNNLAYGSTIHGWSREFLKRTKDVPGSSTPDVVLGWLASLDRGFYVICNPQHVHVTHADIGNLGFQGKMRAAQGEEALQLAEANHYQLARLYALCASEAFKSFRSAITPEAWDVVTRMILGQTEGWINARSKLHQMKITPMIFDE